MHLVTPSMWPASHQRRDRETETLLTAARAHPIYVATAHLSLVDALPEIRRLQDREEQDKS